MEKYKTVFIDFSNHVKSKFNPIVNGDDLARGIEITVNDFDAMGYKLNRIIDPASVGNQGMILLFEKNEKDTL